MVGQVFEAIQSGTKAIKDNKVTIEEVQLCLDELDGAMNSQRQVDEVIGTWLLFCPICLLGRRAIGSIII